MKSMNEDVGTVAVGPTRTKSLLTVANKRKNGNLCSFPIFSQFAGIFDVEIVIYEDEATLTMQLPDSTRK